MKDLLITVCLILFLWPAHLKVTQAASCPEWIEIEVIPKWSESDRLTYDKIKAIAPDISYTSSVMLFRTSDIIAAWTDPIIFSDGSLGRGGTFRHCFKTSNANDKKCDNYITINGGW